MIEDLFCYVDIDPLWEYHEGSPASSLIGRVFPTSSLAAALFEMGFR